MFANCSEKCSNYILIPDAFRYYSERLTLADHVLKRGIYQVLSAPLTSVFLTFKSPTMALR